MLLLTEDMITLRPIYARRAKPGPIALTSRDKRILETIYAFDGMMSLKEIDRLFFSNRGGTWPRERMRSLFANKYVNMPDAANAHRVPLGETIYFLDSGGAEVVAGLYGETITDFDWRKRPRWSLIAHDLAVNDFRMDVMQAAVSSSELALHQWIPESEFWRNPDKITYRTRSGASRKRQMRPDGFFTVRRPVARNPGSNEELAFLLEIDMATEDNPRFAREKVRPGVSYLSSSAYQQHFGIDYGRWLVVTTGERRLDNLKAHTERAGGDGLFLFTTFGQVRSATVLAEPIWQVAGTEETISIKTMSV